MDTWKNANQNTLAGKLWVVPWDFYLFFIANRIFVRTLNLIVNYDTYFGQTNHTNLSLDSEFRWKWRPLPHFIFIKPWSNFESLFVICYLGKVFNANILWTGICIKNLLPFTVEQSAGKFDDKGKSHHVCSKATRIVFGFWSYFYR